MRKLLRGNTVYARVQEDGAYVQDSSGRVEIVYKLNEGAKSYRASSTNLAPTGKSEDESPIDKNINTSAALKAGGTPIKAPGQSKGKSSAPPADAIIVYTDGACTGNPGPMGIGAVIMNGSERLEIGEYIGLGTNNIAELTAIGRAIESIPPRDHARPVLVHTDSSYCIGVLAKNWKAKANVELIAKIRASLKALKDLSFVKVKGHAGIPENERCDQLATEAIVKR